MNKEIEDLYKTMDRLRADLNATSNALAAVMGALPAEVREAALKNVTELSVARSDSFVDAPTPEMRAAIQQALQAEERVFQKLQAAHRRFST